MQENRPFYVPLKDRHRFCGVNQWGYLPCLEPHIEEITRDKPKPSLKDKEHQKKIEIAVHVAIAQELAKVGQGGIEI